jgi:hypothetical protein
MDNYKINIGKKLGYSLLTIILYLCCAQARAEDPELVGWLAVNPWVLENSEMRAHALEVDAGLVKAGAPIGDKAYYLKIESAIKKKFPEYFRKIETERAASDDLTCKDYGLKKGTKDYLDCRIKLREAAVKEREQIRRAAAQGEIERQANVALEAKKLEEQKNIDEARQLYEEEQRKEQRKEQRRYAEQLEMQQRAMQAEIEERRRAREDAKNMRLLEKGLEMMRGY